MGGGGAPYIYIYIYIYIYMFLLVRSGACLFSLVCSFTYEAIFC